MSLQHLRCPGPVSRRSFLEMGSLALGGICLSDLLRHRALAAEAQAKPQAATPDTSVILIWLQGGPSHIDMYDMKPEAPDTIRSPFEQIPTNVPGLDICEHMPGQARIADKFTLIRSITHSWNGHQDGAQRFLTGYNPPRPAMNENVYPSMGAVVAKYREKMDFGVPNYVSSYNGGIQYAGSAYLGKAANPFVVSGDPNADNFQVKNISPPPELAESLDNRAALLKGLDNFRRELDQSGSMDSLDKFNRQALGLLTSEKVRSAFDISQEPDHIRDMYGRHTWGQRALLARRLVESGCSFVSMVMQRSGVGKSHNWDDHAVNWHIFKELELRLPIYDKAVTALIEDIYQRGLDKKVMVVVAGEFGRTPKINFNRGVGRGHYAKAQSVIVSGGGMKMGQVIGSTNDKAEEPKDRPLDPNDLLATIYHYLGIDAHHPYYDHAGRPTRILASGEPISELI
ncbi:hypothetical protein Pan153_07070 [Gimesia panareensis]|uniref:DUF1501 domain-containing protein n=1 Tax=Gimesia panareensis TaxID=2527978 RepID=A0A518FIB5_9PLAN|nr:DUF1501 domain-containing protein [Gimesia panareensis]QDV16086.1 hypothetical protein Pan153_07070 [Gimesia panareensis]